MAHLVTAEWLSKNLDKSNILIFDATWHMPNLGRNAETEFKESHIPNAQFFDIDLISDPDSDLPHMMPSESRMSEFMGKFGLTAESHVVIYDNSNLRSAARAWFMLKSYGVQNISILDGGLASYMALGCPLTDDIFSPVSTNPSGAFKASNIRDFDQMLEIISSNSEQVIDARSADRFNGVVPEPRADLKSGHMPNSFNMPFSRVLKQNGFYHDSKLLSLAFKEIGIDLTRTITCTCGSGMTAAVLLFALELCGAKHTALYDGSWTQWGASKNAPVVTLDKNG
jgi:thiosulfate/3-mercaptopyruvate sulfurtransferase